MNRELQVDQVDRLTAPKFQFKVDEVDMLTAPKLHFQVDQVDRLTAPPNFLIFLYNKGASFCAIRYSLVG